MSEAVSKVKDTLRQLGYNQGTVRSPEDFYITPKIAVVELLRRESFTGYGWECASGSGAISKFFPDIRSSDIRSDETVFGEKGVDFLKTKRKVDFIVTNPPFKLMLPFAKHALECANKVALFGRIQFLEGVERYRFFQENPPKRIYVFSNRLSCYSNGDGKIGGMMCFCWFIWEKYYSGKPEINWILYSEKERKESADIRTYSQYLASDLIGDLDRLPPRRPPY